ncbi:proprotein convertase P-domain-containing protein [Glycomyces paridis]|uniref:proprotein convertase P-domain-containing protein n=1 Tax=Glycomyces paridis TaxID=2126555 RepID=UPI00130541F8|nr:proprotein convertase P-domain-containing protein [Glycomyces paridis]
MSPWTLHARRALAALAAAALTVVALLAVDAAPAQAVRPPGIPSTSTAQSELNGLTVAAESHGSSYDRDLFPHWVSVGGGCTARQYVLKRDGSNVVTGSDCQPDSGSWQSDFDNVWTSTVSNATIDHVVALSEAWASGAWSWTTAQRQAFANDINSPQLWIATTSANSSKSDYDPAEWMPSNASVRCDYVKAWIHVKSLYDLTVDSAEKSALQSHLTNYCGSSGGTPTGCTGAKTTAAAVPEGTPLNSTISLSCTGSASSSSSVSVNVTHPYSGDIAIALVAPDGSTYTLKAASSSTTANVNATYTANLSSESRSGTWTLRVTDTYSGGSSGTLNSWSLAI